MAKTIETRCWYCGKTFAAQRSSARYCSANCRKSYSRIKEKMQTHTQNAGDDLWRMAELIQAYPAWEPYASVLLEHIIREAKRLLNNRVWECQTCGFKVFGKTPPKKCKECKTEPLWKIIDYPKQGWHR